MKITSVDVFLLRSKARSFSWHPVVARVNTDEGISGYGEAGVAYCDAGNGAFGQVQDFAKCVIGWDPMNIEAIWHHLYRDTFWGQGGGTDIFSAMSAIDIALWDIKGKVFNVPVYKLLGGKTQSKLRANASQLQFGWYSDDRALAKPEEYAQAAKQAISEGYTAVKVDPFSMDENGHLAYRNYGLLTHPKLQLYRDRLAAIREVVGPDVDIILECHTGLDVNSAIQFGRMIEGLNIYYMEETCTPLNAPLTRRVKEKINIPLAGGERIYTRFGYRPFFEDRSLDVIQPDLCNCGGISEGKKICDMAYTYEISVQCHVCGSPIAIAAALQLEAVIPNFLIHEHHEVNLKKYNRDFCVYDYQPVNGYYEIPDRPGIGQELSEEAIQSALKVTVK